ncbi:hypothetical protein SAMN05216276_1006155 [Streptosporangium subroseum]|uniref:Isochorismatase family protein n=1 Tax=Streptosporangium subroseum TaxID=106412 RepID=A0A239CXQ5_9ACTN|nr:hypothetical protein [Streptosporangium subroseum]SNS25036.1 hypothetical protein SAMN05216276_1006155 [Streptosporangium subroseum]
MVRFPIEPTRTALLLVDLQRVFVEAAPDGLAVANGSPGLPASAESTASP